MTSTNQLASQQQWYSTPAMRFTSTVVNQTWNSTFLLPGLVNPVMPLHVFGIPRVPYQYHAGQAFAPVVPVPAQLPASAAALSQSAEVCPPSQAKADSDTQNNV